MENCRPNFAKSLAKLNIASSTAFHKQTNKLQDYPIHKADLRTEISIRRNTISIMLHKHGFSLLHCYTLYARIVYIDWAIKTIPVFHYFRVTFRTMAAIIWTPRVFWNAIYDFLVLPLKIKTSEGVFPSLKNNTRFRARFYQSI